MTTDPTCVQWDNVGGVDIHFRWIPEIWETFQRLARRRPTVTAPTTPYTEPEYALALSLKNLLGIPPEIFNRTIAIEVRMRVGHRPTARIEYSPAINEGSVVREFGIIPLSDLNSFSVSAPDPDDSEIEIDYGFISERLTPTPRDSSGDLTPWWWLNDRLFIQQENQDRWVLCAPDSDPNSWHEITVVKTRGQYRAICRDLGVDAGK